VHAICGRKARLAVFRNVVSQGKASNEGEVKVAEKELSSSLHSQPLTCVVQPQPDQSWLIQHDAAR
jgi:hypothetical protein